MKLDAEHVCAQLAGDPQLTLLLDLDGTLIPFAPTLEATCFDRPLVELLAALCDAGVAVVIASGRPRAWIEPCCELVPAVRWVAEHGAWHRDAGGTWHGPASAAAHAEAELAELSALFAPFSAIPGARIENKSASRCLHWRLVPPALKQQMIAAVELACDEWLESHPDFERLDGVEVLEVRHRAAHKGLAVAWAREQIPGARIIAIGDDDTDEDMFAALGPGELPIGVGPRRTARKYWLPDPTAVRAFLWWLFETRTRRDRTLPFRGPTRGRTVEPPAAARLVVVSNRIPPTTVGRQRSVGGLVSALEPALAVNDGVWLGWSGNEARGARELSIEESSRPVRASFDLAPALKQGYYSGLCNRALWPLFHGFAGRVRYADEDWKAYVQANDEFAAHACALAAGDGSVWMHDYHLLLAGRAMRHRGFAGPLGLFLHIPFPPRDLFDTLPWADDLIAGMLAFDLVGFHTENWADNFRACMRGRSLDREPDICVLPVGIDPAPFAINGGEPDREIVRLQTTLGHRRLILGVDRLDHTKGIPERLRGFERLLELQPEWRGQISFVQISVPSRADVPEYAQLRREVENLVGRINGRFGEADWVPVRYLYRSYDHQVLAQLYRAADVALVTPLRDGLNLVAKEFVAAQDPDHPGVLVLSRFAGAAAELHAAVLTNPYHPEGLAADLAYALRMEQPERKRRHALLAAAIAGKTPQRWATAFLDRLDGARRSAAVA